MTRQALMVDETQDLEEADLKTMSEAMDTGTIKIDRVESKIFEAETRCLFCCNPIDPRRRTNQAPMAGFLYGCTAIKDIFPIMFIRRVDLCVFAASGDIEDVSKLFTARPSEPEFLTEERLQALIHFAWNLKDDQVVISREVNDLILKRSHELSEKSGKCDDLPIVYPQDFRKTFARLCVALAVLDLSSDDDFQTIVVTRHHVDFMFGHLRMVYSAKNCRLDKYSNRYGEEHKMDEKEFSRVVEKIEGYVGDASAKKHRIALIDH